MYKKKYLLKYIQSLREGRFCVEVIFCTVENFQHSWNSVVIPEFSLKLQTEFIHGVNINKGYIKDFI